MSRLGLPPVLLLLALCAGLGAEARAPLISSIDFETLALPETWRNEGSGQAAIEPVSGSSRALMVACGETGNQMVSIPLPLAQIRGSRITLSGRVKADKVSRPAEPWNGVKFMIHTVSPNRSDYQGVMELFGTFGWKDLGLGATIPPGTSEASIILGIQDAVGQVWFDDIKVTLSGSPRKRPVSRPPLLPPEKLDRRSDVPRLRGVMYGPKGKEEDLRELARWKVNLIRWQFYWWDGTFPEKRLDLGLYQKWLEETISEVDRWLPLCQELGIRVIIDLHTPPGAGVSGQWAMFEKEAYQKNFIETWDRLAAHYKDKPGIWGYDLVNEPVEGKVAEGLLNWRALAEHVSRRVRSIDPKRAILIEPGPHGGWGNLAFFEPIPVPGIIYSVHLYEPMAFTHQGVLDGMPTGKDYPGVFDGVYWDKAKLKEALQPVREYQRDYNVPIYIGEFSAPRWAPGDSAARYLQDCIEIFEEYGWDWSYHAFREWHGWNVELGADIADETPSAEPTSRENVLRDAFSKNQKPR